jgi:hypothetical protein
LSEKEADAARVKRDLQERLTELARENSELAEAKVSLAARATTAERAAAVSLSCQSPAVKSDQAQHIAFLE